MADLINTSGRLIDIEVTPAMDEVEAGSSTGSLSSASAATAVVASAAAADPGPSRLPWGAYRERIEFPDHIAISTNAKSGEFILQTLFGEFTALAEKKINAVLESTDQQKPLSKSLQRGEDPSFDQLLNSMNSVAEHCLPSLVHTLFQWYERQNPAQEASKKAKATGEKEFLVEKRELAIEFILLMVLVEVLKQLPYHPGHDELVNHIICHAFKHFKYKEGTQGSPNAGNMNIIADLSAEVMGVLAQSRFTAVRKHFFSELKELRSKEQNPFNTQAIISLLMGMKFFRVKMHPIEEFQASIQFLQECGNYFLEVKDKDIKHALAGLFVEILLPVAAVVKNEVNVPVLKNFVEMLYSATLDIANKKKHSLALFPMVTCLLCVSQKQFFLNNWPYFLTMCLSHLKDRDPKMARVALESLYRLLWCIVKLVQDRPVATILLVPAWPHWAWYSTLLQLARALPFMFHKSRVYMIRIKCESNTATNSRLLSIVNSLFPKGSKAVVPRDTPLNIFVKIIQFIGQERLDFAMREIIFDLLYVGRPIRFLTPERMSIGLRSFLVIADSLQRKEADPPMPQTMGVMPSGNTLRFKKTFINKYLSDDTAKMIGMAAYYPHVRKAFDSILRLLDSQVGKPMLMTKTENVHREPEEIITGERKPKIDLFRTCVAAVPRLLPEGMSSHELIELLSRLTVHMDDELGKLAFQSLQNIVVDLPEWRNDVLRGFVQFIQKEVNDTFSQLLDQCNRRLISLLTQWKTVAQSAQANKERLEKLSVPSAPVSHHLKMTERFHGPQTPHHIDAKLDHRPLTASKEELAAHRLQREHGHQRATLHELEGFALVMLCSCKPIVRKLAVVILKEVRNLFSLLGIPKDTEPCVLDVMDRSCPVVIERVLPYLPQTEKAAALSASPLDFQWLADRTSIIWTSAGYHDINDGVGGSGGAGSGGGHYGSSNNRFEAWIECMSIFMHHEYVMGHCPTAVSSAWPILYGRLQALFTHVDPNTTVNESRTSSILGRPGSKKLTNERDLYMNLWQNYVVMGCCISPSSQVAEHRSASPELTSSPDSSTSERLEMKSPSANMTAKDLFKTLVPLIRCDVADMRETVVIGLGRINPEAFRDLTEELVPIIKEAIDRKQENVRRRKRRDVLRLALVRIFRYMAQNGIFAQSPAGVIEQSTNALCMTFVEYIEGARLFLENEGEKELPILQEIRLHFAEFCRHLIRNTSVDTRGKLLSRDLRYSLFYLFASWSGKFGSTFGAIDRRPSKEERCNELDLTAVQAMSAVLCCGSVFDPSGLNDDGYIYSWLDTLLGAHDEKIYKLAQETVVLLLEFNPDAQALLDWVIDRCYTGSHEVADGCFNALASVFNNREYPCDHVAMLNVTLLNTGCPRIAIHETAVQLLHLLYKRFFLDDVCMTAVHTDTSTDTDKVGSRDGADLSAGSVAAMALKAEEEERATLQDMLLSGPYSRSQIWLSETLARLHPELTMPIFSEITHRFQTAVPALRQVLLQYLLPWLYNMELVDPNVCNTLTNFLNKLAENRTLYTQPFLKGEGWGSPQATEMVLNNLMYITCKFGDDHAKEIEDLWAALVACWPGNLKVIIRYIIIITGMAPANLLPYTKRVVVYLGRAKPDHIVDEMMTELQTVEALTFNVERTQTPPFYRLTSLRPRASAAAVLEEMPEQAGGGQPLLLDKGQIHTKRHSGEDPSKVATADITPRANSSPSLKSEASTASSIAPSVKTTTTDSELDLEVLNLAVLSARPQHEQPKRADSPMPYPLPMPAYGGFFAPLSELLPEGNLPNPPYQRCNLAVMLMTDLIVDGIDIDWTIHLPHILHIIFLGLDNSRSLIHEHCKRLLLNLLLVLPAHNDHFSVAKILLSNKAANEDTALTLPNAIAKDFKFIEEFEKDFTREKEQPEGAEGGEPGPAIQQTGPRKSLGSGTLATDSVSSLVDVDLLSSTEDVAKALIEFLVTRKCRPLWSYEDITAKVHSIRSAEQLEHFLRYSLRIFNESLPQAHLEQRWALVALQLALCCSSRHYAGRSFQVFRALHVPLTTQMLSDILSRLVETVAEQGEDMQGYVTEIILTLEAAVDNLNVDFRPIDFVKELFMSTPNLNKEPRLELKKSATVALRQSTQHYRSTSYSLANVMRRPVSAVPSTASPAPAAATTVTPSPSAVETKVKPRKKVASTSDIEDPPKSHWKTRTSSLKEQRQHRVSTGELDSRKNTNLSRSRSAQSLKQLQEPTGHDDKLTLLTQMFWISVSLLESDYEHEFLLAVRLLDKILKHIQPDRPECREKLDKILQQLMWPSFPGVQALLLKGCTSPVTAEPTWTLLSRLTLCINAPVIDPSQCVGFPLNVIALLPYLVEHYEENNKVCTEAADHISQMCIEQTDKLDNLATVMTLYSRGVFGKDNFQWTKCVIKYLYDVYSNLSASMIVFLVEVLDKGPPSTQSAVLQILHCIIHYIDIASSPAPLLNAELFRVVSKYVEGPHWREAIKILKLCVTRSSTLSAPPPSMVSCTILDASLVSLTTHTSFAEAEVSFKKELPGRTIEFEFDVGKANIIGKKYQDLGATSLESEAADKDKKAEAVSDKASQITTATSSSGQSNGDVVVWGWRKPQLSQARTRERLVNLLTSYGQRVGLPKSPSVIFSQSSDTIERQASMCSSSEEASLAEGEMKMDDDSSADQQFQVFKDFDFLDIELDEMESDGVDKFNWGVKRHSLSLEEAEGINETSRSTGGSLKEDSSDDEERAPSVSPMDEYPIDLATSSTITLQNTAMLEPVIRRHSSPLSGSSHSIHSGGSEADMADLSPSHASPNFSNMAVLCIQSDEIEDIWRSHVNRVMTDSTATYAVNTFHLFARLLQETQRKLQTLTKEACYFLSKTDAVRSLAHQLSSMLEILCIEMECPLVYADVETLTACKMIERHKFSILEIHESYETYLLRKEQANECLDGLKSSVKLQSLGESMPDFCGDEQKVELCRCLYKLQFQLLQLFEGYSKLVDSLAQASKPPQVVDLSEEVMVLREDLQRAQQEVEADQEVLSYIVDVNTLSRDDAERLLIDCITSKQFVKAVVAMRKLRPLFPGDMFGVNPSDEVEGLLFIYCKHQAEAKPGVVAITKSNHDLSEVCTRLMDIKVQLSMVIAQIEQQAITPTAKIEHETLMKLPESSTL